MVKYQELCLCYRNLAMLWFSFLHFFLFLWPLYLKYNLSRKEMKGIRGIVTVIPTDQVNTNCVDFWLSRFSLSLISPNYIYFKVSLFDMSDWIRRIGLEQLSNDPVLSKCVNILLSRFSLGLISLNYIYF